MVEVKFQVLNALKNPEGTGLNTLLHDGDDWLSTLVCDSNLLLNVSGIESCGSDENDHYVTVVDCRPNLLRQDRPWAGVVLGEVDGDSEGLQLPPNQVDKRCVLGSMTEENFQLLGYRPRLLEPANEVLLRPRWRGGPGTVCHGRMIQLGIFSRLPNVASNSEPKA